ncbi:hypothetical protein UFOVP451_44 [uncultured Caudovirales phage]|uniref:Uncharacterized protein n=1 Tax=uncultured Caudovirales phage TaxID=2100421 RepID=A0A6J5MAF0_9CAUD|nr:hypothetical protein UFOVP451_44 [uncultured Caudovirales phage]
MTIEIRVKYGREHIDRLYGWLLFELVDLASERKPLINETSAGVLKIFKHTTSAGETYYNVYYFKNSFMRRLYNRITKKGG